MKELIGQIADHGYQSYTGARESDGKKGLPTTAENLYPRESIGEREQELLDYLLTYGESTCKAIRKALHMSTCELNSVSARLTRVEGVGLYEDNIGRTNYMGLM